MEEARALKAKADEENYLFHLRVYELLKSERRAEITAKAEKRVLQWESGRFCSKDYIDGWRAALADLKVYKDVVLGRGDNGVAMRQNSAVSFLITELMK